MKLFICSAIALFVVGCTTAANPEIKGPYFMSHADHDKICFIKGTDVVCDYHEHGAHDNKNVQEVPFKPHDQYHPHTHSKK
jgi:hypothetical protein